jgi:hypothetical protein
VALCGNTGGTGALANYSMVQHIASPSLTGDAAKFRLELVHVDDHMPNKRGTSFRSHIKTPGTSGSREGV